MPDAATLIRSVQALSTVIASARRSCSDISVRGQDGATRSPPILCQSPGRCPCRLGLSCGGSNLHPLVLRWRGIAKGLAAGPRANEGLNDLLDPFRAGNVEM